jgi:ABC-2 type transport system permease protein
MILATLVRKQLRDMLWPLFFCALGYAGISVLFVWGTMRSERDLAKDDVLQARTQMFLRMFGGPAMDYSTLAIEACMYNHPFILLTMLGWSIARGSASVAGEIERGTLDLTLSRPVPRWMYLSAQVLVGVLSIAMLAATIVTATLIANRFFPLRDPPTALALARPATMLVALGVAVFGYTVPFSAIDSVRWRPGVVAMGVTLLGLVGIMLARQFEGYEWIEKFSVMRAYAPVTVAVKGAPLAHNGGILAGVFAAGVVLAFLAFTRRDLPTSGG